MTIHEKLIHAARFRLAPRFTLWHVSAQGEYRRLMASDSALETANRFVAEAVRPETIGLEIRCDGVRVSL